MTALVFIVLAALAAVYDVVTLAWHRARERGHVARTVALGCALEAMAAVPIVTAFELGTWWPLAAGVIGSAIGTSWGMRRANPS